MAGTAGTAARDAGKGAKDVAESGWIQTLGRVGLVSYGVVNLLIAWLAAQIALTGGGGQDADKSGALKTLAGQPFGAVLLWILAIGLAALAVWQLAEAIWGYRYVSDQRKRTLKRVVAAIEAVVFAAFAVSAAQVAVGSSSGSGGGGEPSSLTARVLELPGGQVLVGLIGLVIVGVSAAVVRHGLAKKFLEDLDLRSAPARDRTVTTRLGQAGYAALGVVYGIIGILVVVAAVNYDPEQATGLDGALQTLAGQPFGVGLLLVVAAGLACFGGFCFADARYRRG